MFFDIFQLFRMMKRTLYGGNFSILWNLRFSSNKYQSNYFHVKFQHLCITKTFSNFIVCSIKGQDGEEDKIIGLTLNSLDSLMRSCARITSPFFGLPSSTILSSSVRSSGALASASWICCAIWSSSSAPDSRKLRKRRKLLLNYHLRSSLICKFIILYFVGSVNKTFLTRNIFFFWWGDQNAKQKMFA